MIVLKEPQKKEPFRFFVRLGLQYRPKDFCIVVLSVVHGKGRTIMKDAETEMMRLMIERGVSRDTILGIALRLRHPEKTEQMLEWLKANEPTINEICEKSREIARKVETEVEGGEPALSRSDRERC